MVCALVFFRGRGLWWDPKSCPPTSRGALLIHEDPIPGAAERCPNAQALPCSSLWPFAVVPLPLVTLQVLPLEYASVVSSLGCCE